MEELFRAFGTIWPYLTLIGGLIAYIYLSDRVSIGKRFESAKERHATLEKRVSTIELSYLPRPAAEVMIKNTEDKFQREHENIIGAVNQSKREVMDRLDILDERILDLIRGNRG